MTVVLFSGGQDSTTCLAWAMGRFKAVDAYTVDYGQFHVVEIEQARRIIDMVNEDIHAMGDAHSPIRHKVASVLIAANSSLNGGPDVPHLATPGVPLGPDTPAAPGTPPLPATWLPGRNAVLFSMAAAFAVSRGHDSIVTGVCQTDFSGYPDCREVFVRSMETSLSFAMNRSFRIHAPLMHMTKADTVRLAQSLGAMDLLALSHTCYRGVRPGCGECAACKLRAKGFAEAGVPDPLFAAKKP